jgi:hypothetical protein
LARFSLTFPPGSLFPGGLHLPLSYPTDHTKEPVRPEECGRLGLGPPQRVAGLTVPGLLEGQALDVVRPEDLVIQAQRRTADPSQHPTLASTPEITCGMRLPLLGAARAI